MVEKIEAGKYADCTPGNVRLRGVIKKYVHFSTDRGKGLKKNIWPSPYIQLFFHFKKGKINNISTSEISILGLHGDVYDIQAEESEIDVVIVYFTSTGFYELTGIDSENFTGRVIDGAGILERKLQRLYYILQSETAVDKRNDLMDQFFLQLLGSINEDTNCFNELTEIILKKPDFQFSENLGISYRHFARMFKKNVGVNLQTFRRLSRFELAKNSMIDNQENSLTSIGYDSGYYDQSHFSKEFKKLTGVHAKYFEPLCKI